MNLRLLFSLCCSLCCSFALLAQPPGGRGRGDGTPPTATIIGKVVDADTDTPLEFATITLFSKRDSAIVSGSITDIDGAFKIETRPRRFFAKVEFIGYKALILTEIPISREQFTADLGEIRLETDAATLAEVEVRAEKSDFTIALDKKIFNVGKDLANQGGSAEDILDNVPSVAVDIDGNVSLRGSGNVRILVDGKPSTIISADNAGGLRSLPANMIEQIEVITNPSARYEAEGMSGIINIVLRKERNKGLNGSFDVTAGVPDNYGVGINLNYRKNKLNWFTNIGARYRKNPGTSMLHQELYFDDKTIITDQSRESLRGGLSGNFRFGADYFFTPKDILTTSFTYRRSNEDNLTTYLYRDYLNDLDNLTLVTSREDDELEKEQELQYVLTYRKKFEQKGRELVADVRYSDSTEDEGSDFTESYLDANNAPADADLLQRSANKEGENSLRLQLDYVHPFAADGKFEVGYLSSFRNIGNDYLVEELADGAWSALDGLSNEFEYNEDVHAVYVMLGNKTGRFSYQGGLRGELSAIKTELKTTNELNERDYANLFPTASLSYQLSEKDVMQMSYSRRTRRPRFWDLNPFFTFSDSRNFFSGNPDLNPEFTNSYELSYIKYWEKGSLSSALYHRNTTDVIARIFTPNPDGTSVRRPENLTVRNNYGLELTFSANPTKWWRINGDVNFFRAITDAVADKGIVGSDTYSWRSRLTSRTTIAKEVDIQLRLNYRGAQDSPDGTRRLPLYSIDLGASKDILKKKGTLTLSVRDLMNSRRRRSILDSPTLFQESDFQWRSRQATLTLNYRLNQDKKRGRGRGEGGGNFGGDGGDF